MIKKEEKKLIEFLHNELEKKVELKNSILTCYCNEIEIELLGRILNIPSSLIISFFWSKGKIFTKNQLIDFEMISDYFESKKIKVIRGEKVNVNKIIEDYLKNKEKIKSIELEEKIPIISVMGHIDHGKSTLIDTIRNSKEQIKEAGGITQKINIYPINFKKKKFIFLDTPGHNVFLKMREKGALITDLVILVIDSEDGIMSQTIEIIEYIHKYKIPNIVFINNKKKNKNNNLERITSSLYEKNIISSKWGGDTSIILGSAIDKNDTELLLEEIKLISEVYEWKAEKNCLAKGIIINSYFDNKEGVVNVLLIKSGFLKNKDFIFTNGEYGKIRKIIDFNEKILEKAFPGEIVRVFGLGFKSEMNDRNDFLVINEENLIKKINKIIPKKSSGLKNLQKINEISLENLNKKNVNLILISDSQNSLYALENLIKNIKFDNINLNCILSEIGEINDSIISISKITQGLIIFFNVNLNQKKMKELKENKINWLSSSIIYEIGEKINKNIKLIKNKKKIEKISGIAMIKEVFYFSKVGNIAGFQVERGSGPINRNQLIEIFRKDDKLFTGGKIKSLQKDKKNVKEVIGGQEGAITIEFQDFKIGDKIISYSLVEEENDD